MRAGKSVFTVGFNNAFFGQGAGFRNISGVNNTFIGAQANFNASNTTGDNNTLLGYNTIVNSGVSHATAIGYRAQLEQDDSLVLGAINGVDNCTAGNNCDSVKVASAPPRLTPSSMSNATKTPSPKPPASPPTA